MALSRLRALLLQGGQPLGVGLLAEGGARALEGRQHAGGIELGALVVGARRLGVLDALLGRLGLALELGEIAVDGGKLALDLGDARLDGDETLLRVLGALLLDLVLVLQGGELGHALAIDRPLALLRACLRRRDPRPAPRRAWRRSPWPWRRARSCARRIRRRAPGRSAFSRDSSSVSEIFLSARPAWPLCAVAMRSCCWSMARRRSSICCTKYFSISPCAPCAAWPRLDSCLS